MVPGGQRQLKLPSPSEMQTPLLRHWQKNKKLRELRINKSNYIKIKKKIELTGLGTQASQI